MKTKEELNALKEEVETVNKKLAELTEEELTQVSGGIDLPDRSGGRAPDIILNRASKQEFGDQTLPADPGPLTQFPTTKQRGIGTVPAASRNKEILEKLLSTVTEFETPDSN